MGEARFECVGESVVAAMNRPGVSFGRLLVSIASSVRSGAGRPRPPKAKRGGWAVDVEVPRAGRDESALMLRFSSGAAAAILLERPRGESLKEGRGDVGSAR